MSKRDATAANDGAASYAEPARAARQNNWAYEGIADESNALARARNANDWPDILNYTHVILNYNRVILNYTHVIQDYKPHNLNYTHVILNYIAVILNYTAVIQNYTRVIGDVRPCSGLVWRVILRLVVVIFNSCPAILRLVIQFAADDGEV